MSRPVRQSGDSTAAIAAGIVTAGLLAMIRAKSPFPILLADRFLPGSGWIEIAALGGYAAWLAHLLEKARQPRAWATIRRRAWLFFGLVFFAQLALGLAGIERLLMTGTLHLPIPAVILGGPLFRGEGFFMLILFAATLLIVGPAWCSWLCYLGSLDLAAASASARSRLSAGDSRRRRAAQIAIALLFLAAALALRHAEASRAIAVFAALGFGMAGLGVMALLSRRAGVMLHCAAWCPTGLVATLVGRLHPFHLRIGAACDDCGACTASCRYDALGKDAIARRRVAASCTLCGDCLDACPRDALTYACGPLRGEAARRLAIVLFAVLHAVFLGCARI